MVCMFPRARGPRTALLAVCTGACASPDPSPPIEQLLGSWHLASAEVPAGIRAPTLTIGADGAISGHAGVNQFRGAVDLPALRAGRWQPKPIVTTKMAGPPEAMALEARVLEGLSTARQVDLRDRVLQLRSGADVVLRFERE